MAIPHTVESYIAERGIPYDVISHEHSHSSAQTAELAHVPGDRLAKSVILEDDAGYVMAVLPTTCHVRLGRFWKVKGPGLVLVIVGVQQMVRVDLRTIVMDVPPQDVITHDNVSVKVNAVVYFRVVDPEKSVIQVAKFLEATSQLAQTTLRAILGKHGLDELLSERERLNTDIQRVLDAQTDAWGVKVSTVEIKQVDLNESMIRAIARQAEAERERRAKIIHAEGELQASEKLLQAAQMLARQPQAMQLRYLQTLGNIAGDKSSTIVFPLPMEFLSALGVGKAPPAAT